MIYLVDIAQFLDQYFAIDRYSEDPGGVYWSSTLPIRRFGVALEPGSQLADWAIAERLDGLFLHRPWKLQSNQLPPDIGVVAYHLPFDERLTLGFNPRLAEVLGMLELEALGEKAGRAIGMIGEIPTQSFADYCCYLNEVFGGQDAAHAGGQNEIKRLAVVGAMTDALVRSAALRGADMYITGQLRQPAFAAVLETGISVVEIGHRRCEEWGLRVLAGVLRERWTQLEVVIFN